MVSNKFFSDNSFTLLIPVQKPSQLFVVSGGVSIGYPRSRVPCTGMEDGSGGQALTPQNYW